MTNRDRRKFNVGMPDAGHVPCAWEHCPGVERPRWWQTPLDDGLACFVLAVEFAVTCGVHEKIPRDVILGRLVVAAERSLTAEDFPAWLASDSEVPSGVELFFRIKFHALFRSCLDADGFSRRDGHAVELVVSLSRRVAEAALSATPRTHDAAAVPRTPARRQTKGRHLNRGRAITAPRRLHEDDDPRRHRTRTFGCSTAFTRGPVGQRRQASAGSPSWTLAVQGSLTGIRGTIERPRWASRSKTVASSANTPEDSRPPRVAWAASRPPRTLLRRIGHT